jgi:ribosomal protein S18 acetylase RimI-like enzyme
MHTDLLIPPNGNQHLRRLDARRDLVAVADLVELCFNDTLDPEGRSYLKQMRQAAQHARLIGWANSLALDAGMSPAGLVWEEDSPDGGGPRLVGNLSLIPIGLQGKRGYLIANVAVHPDFRGRGIGRSLTLTALEMMRSRGAPAAWLQVRNDNPAAIRIYQATGFKERARRSSWITTSEIPADGSPAGVSVGSRQGSHWAQQKSWLRTLYPAELSWHLPLDWKALAPTLEGMLYRFLSWEYPRHWAALRNGRLAGVLTWFRSSSYADRLLLAAPAEIDEDALVSLLATARRGIARKRPLALNLPAEMADKALRRAGFSTHQTLIWMEYRFRNFQSEHA